MKTFEELNKLNTKRLLAYYQAERKRFYRDEPVCECCGSFTWELDPSLLHLKKEYETTKEYLELIKLVLNTREHVKKK